MNERIKKELETTEHKKTNLTPLLVTVALILLVTFYLFIIPRAEKPEPKRTVRTVTQKQTAPKPKAIVSSKTFSVPANGTIRIPRTASCNVDNIPNEKQKHIKRTPTLDWVEYTSTSDTPVFAKIWFYNKEGSQNCIDRLHILNSNNEFDE